MRLRFGTTTFGTFVIKTLSNVTQCKLVQSTIINYLLPWLDQKESFCSLVRRKAPLARHMTKNTKIYYERLNWQNKFKINPK